MLKACKHFLLKLGYPNGQAKAYILPDDAVEVFLQEKESQYKSYYITGIRKSYLEHLQKHPECLIEISLTPEALQHLL
jgi:hypothetical protein